MLHQRTVLRAPILPGKIFIFRLEDLFTPAHQPARNVPRGMHQLDAWLIARAKANAAPHPPRAN